MSRPLRVNVPNGWYHAMSRGIDGRRIFGDEREHRHFLELLEEMVGRFAVKLHAYVPMGNHYHLLVQTPHANLSRAMQWLQVSYGMWFNRRHERVGPLFQGRYKSVPVDGEGSWALQASEYLHLNPVRLKGLGLGKSDRKAQAGGLGRPPPPELVKARLAALRGHPWSSYPAYAGYVPRPSWLTCAELWQRARHGGLSATESYRWQIEEPLKAGVEPVGTLAEELRKGLAVGSAAFIESLRRLARGDRRTQPAVRQWQRLLPFSRVREVVAAAKGEPWARFRDRHGDDGRDAALWLGRRHGGLTLRELGAAAGGLSADAVGSAVRRVEHRRHQNARYRSWSNRLEKQLLDNQT